MHHKAIKSQIRKQLKTKYPNQYSHTVLGFPFQFPFHHTNINENK